VIETARGTAHEWQRNHLGHINVRAYLDFLAETCSIFDYTVACLDPKTRTSPSFPPNVAAQAEELKWPQTSAVRAQ